jgi:peptidoglycan/xylan/chitin deacetylase (PgdA/CDA1 family)
MPSCVILYYHSIPNTARARFAAQLDALLELATPISIATVPLLPPARGQHYCAVTFDDGIRDVVENAVPELQKRNIPATMFVVASALGRHAWWWPPSALSEPQAPVISAEQLRALPSGLISIGSHTLTHPMLPCLKEEEARRELYGSRAVLEQILGRRVTLFSFPFGAFSPALISWCREAGYERVFTSTPGLSFQDPHEFVSGRVPVDATASMLEFRLKVLGAYRWLPYAISLKRRLTCRPVPTSLRSLLAQFWPADPT